jgi:hypothetical protein
METWYISIMVSPGELGFFTSFTITGSHDQEIYGRLQARQRLLKRLLLSKELGV